VGHARCACSKEQPPPIIRCWWWVLGRPQWHHHQLWGLLTLSLWYCILYNTLLACSSFHMVADLLLWHCLMESLRHRIVCFGLYSLYSCVCTWIIETTCLYQHLLWAPFTWEVSLSSLQFFKQRICPLVSKIIYNTCEWLLQYIINCLTDGISGTVFSVLQVIHRSPEFPFLVM
jgi:hypothetical protein